MEFKTNSEDETIALGTYLGSLLQQGDIVALQGLLAAGKTHLTKGIALGLGVADSVTSPTFTLISEYSGRLPLYHMDVYRLGSAEEFLDIGAEELLYGQGVCVIEWSEKIMSELPPDTITIHITVNEDTSRTITLDQWPYDITGIQAFEV